ncbi:MULTISPECIES: hypothetical protein [Bacteroides]|uniref:hypothetical protein n=1 Tax=Bacteroides TaxID=816 RepID=UPI00222000C0|nr:MULTISPECIES: hypothetical protein [Bacteroides]UYU41013.1 hypothetical protein KQP71_00690 [Bacteroides salyersiae]UYU45666.1 hypothetical protein KQP70_03900 [Bacteroides salyersiae]
MKKRKMKGLFYLFLCLCVCISLVSCEDEEDNAIKLTVNTSAYDVVKGLKSVDGNLLFTGELTDGLQLRFTYLVLKQGEEEVSIVAKDTRYVSNVKDVASYTTGELEPGEYRVVVVSDFVRGDKEFNWLAFDTQTKGFSVICVENVGVYNAFGVAYMDGVVVDSKKTITLNTVRQGCVVTFLLKNRDKMINNFYNLEGTDHFKYTISGDLEEELDVLEKAWETQRQWNSSVAGIQHYIPAFEALFVYWQGDVLGILLKDAPTATLELDFATGTITAKP